MVLGAALLAARGGSRECWLGVPSRKWAQSRLPLACPKRNAVIASLRARRRATSQLPCPSMEQSNGPRNGATRFTHKPNSNTSHLLA
eukprot:4768973-Prymnesium_polylepis.1